MNPKDEEMAIFWCSLLEPVLFGEVDEKETNQFLKKLAEEERRFPNGVKKKPALSTLKRKLKTYRQAGFKALERRPRADRGKARAHSKELIDKAVDIKRDQPRRSDETINQFLKVQHGKTIPKSTLYRHLKEAGATRLKLGVVQTPVRRRWSRDHTHDLWIGDFEEGPFCLFEGQAVETHLCAFIDCHSRYLVEGRYYFRQNLDILIDSLLRAWPVHGHSDELYVDNAKIYHANAFKAALYALHIHLLHRKPGDPPPGGLIERIFGTAQSQFEEEVRKGNILTLDELNRAFSAWLEMSYHRKPHSETGEPPKERYEKGLKVIRPVDMQAVIPYFMSRAERRVHKDFSDVQLDGAFYRVDKRLRGDRVEVRFDPFAASATVLIYSRAGVYLGKGTLHHREQGENASQPEARGKPQYDYLGLLVQEHEKELRKKSQGIDYRKAVAERHWPFTAFAKALAQLLGRKGDLTAFSTQELAILQKFYDRNPQLTQSQLLEACERAQEKTIPYVLYEGEKPPPRNRKE